VLVVVLGAAACGGERTTPTSPAGGAPGLGGPLAGGPSGAVPTATALPDRPCPPPPVRIDEQVEGLVLPEGGYLTEVVRQGPLVQVRGWVERTPLELRAEYEQRTDVEVLTLEDEVVEVETLVTDGEHRTFLRGTALCATASALDGLVAVETG
jgi:hypothetical protein